jgi:hypothetical protein
MTESVVWVEDRRWRKLPAPKRCRRVGIRGRAACPNMTSYALMRSNGLWAYCEEHMYGQRIRDGIVEISVHPDSPAAKRGYVD